MYNDCKKKKHLKICNIIVSKENDIVFSSNK
jgi:hypothetical protein